MWGHNSTVFIGICKRSPSLPTSGKSRFPSFPSPWRVLEGGGSRHNLASWENFQLRERLRFRSPWERVGCGRKKPWLVNEAMNVALLAVCASNPASSTLTLYIAFGSYCFWSQNHQISNNEYRSSILGQMWKHFGMIVYDCAPKQSSGLLCAVIDNMTAWVEVCQ